MPMTFVELFDAADRAAHGGKLDFSDIPFRALVDWREMMHADQDGATVAEVMAGYEAWWRQYQ